MTEKHSKDNRTDYDEMLYGITITNRGKLYKHESGIKNYELRVVNPTMKILFIITKSNWGGAQRYVYDLAEHFSADAGFDIAVALGGNGNLKQKLEEKNIRVIQIAALERNIKMTGDIRAFFELFKLLHEEKPDIVHLNSTKAGLLGSLASFFYKLTTNDYRLTTIFTAHGWAWNEPRPWWQKLLIKKTQWLTMLLSDRTIVVSEHLKKQTRWWLFVSRKISVIHNGVPELSFLPRDEARQWLRIPSHVFAVGSIAELHKNKGLDVAIEALSLLRDKNVTYTIVGEGEERATLEMLIKWHELEERVSLAGHIDEAYKYLKAFDVFLLPSRTEALSYALLEALQAGLPIVATNVGGIPEVVEHKKTGLLVPPENPRALAHALRFMMTHPDARESAGREFKNKIKKNFAIAKMFANTQNIYATPLVPFVKKRGYAYSTPSRK